MDAEFDAWLELIHRNGLGRDKLRQLLAAFGSAQAVLAASGAALRAVAGPRAGVDDFMQSTAEVAPRVAVSQAWLGAQPDRHLITLADAAYPALLLQISDPPLALFVEGDLQALAQPALAIVGSRSATPQGLANASAFARELARQGWGVVSGLAAGIDAAAHEGALAGGGRTIAVVGTGLDQVYPRSNRALAARIRAQGALISEYTPGTPPLAAHFPQRNRIIAALTRGTLVVEAAVQSGSLITARLAAEAGREVFAIPGSIHSPQVKGCHALLRQGAKLVETAADVIEELRSSGGVPAVSSQSQSPDDAVAADDPTADNSAAADPVLRALGHDPASLDALMARCGWPAHELSAKLLELELMGHVARLPGGLFQRLQQA